MVVEISPNYCDREEVIEERKEERKKGHERNFFQCVKISGLYQIKVVFYLILPDAFNMINFRK